MITYIGYVDENIDFDKVIRMYRANNTHVYGKYKLCDTAINGRKIKDGFDDVQIHFDKSVHFDFKPNVILECTTVYELYKVIDALLDMLRTEQDKHHCISNSEIKSIIFISTQSQTDDDAINAATSLNNEYISEDRTYSSKYPGMLYGTIDILGRSFVWVEYIVINDPYSKIIINGMEYIGKKYGGK